MPLSSNTLIHFTASKETLKSILAENFRVKYCKETIIWGKNAKSAIRVPMVSFCDIPLSQIKDHISKYGHYGIGLTRAWAIKNQLNPVLYVEPGSSLSISYSSLLGDVKRHFKQDIAAIRRATDIARYIKNYEATLERGGRTYRKYRFSDEREWRYVPPHSANCRSYYSEAAFNKPGVADEAAADVEKMRLKFKPNDVKYIIIKNDKEIGEFIEHLRTAKGKNYSHSDIERLTTRLFTSDQIHCDI